MSMNGLFLIYVAMHLSWLFQRVSPGNCGFTEVGISLRSVPGMWWLRKYLLTSTIWLITYAGVTSCPSKFNQWELHTYTVKFLSGFWTFSLISCIFFIVCHQHYWVANTCLTQRQWLDIIASKVYCCQKLIRYD